MPFRLPRALSAVLRHTALSSILVLPCLGTSPAAHAASLSSVDSNATFTPTQRAAIVEIVRNALKTDPTILSDAITALRANAQEAREHATMDAVGKNRDALEHNATDAVFGNAKASTTLVEFYDPRCPYCRKVLPDLATLVAHDGNLKLIEKIIPVLGDGSVLDSKAIVAAGLQGKYGQMQTALMTDSTKPSIERIHDLATKQGLDVTKLAADMDSPAVAAIIQANLDLSRSLGVDGTPTFIVGGKTVIPGAVTADELRTEIAKVRQN